MAVPTSYTETQLKTYMHSVLGGLSADLSWTVAGGSYDETVNDALNGYGQTDISLITGATSINLLRAYARYFLYRSVAMATVGKMDYTHADSGAAYKFSQIHKQAKEMMQIAADDITQLGGDVSGYSVDFLDIVYTDDLYTATDNSLTAGNEWSRIS